MKVLIIGMRGSEKELGRILQEKWCLETLCRNADEAWNVLCQETYPDLVLIEEQEEVLTNAFLLLGAKVVIFGNGLSKRQREEGWEKYVLHLRAEAYYDLENPLEATAAHISGIYRRYSMTSTH